MDASGHHHESHPALPKLVLRHEFEASRRVVFRAWTDPKRLARWWGPHGFTNPVCEIDARAGGALRIEMRGPDGAVYPMTGTVREIAPPERLVLACKVPDEAGRPLFEVLNTVTFSERSGRTTAAVDARVVASTPGAAKYLEGMEEGWRQSLDRLDQLLRAPAAGAHGRRAEHGLSDTADRELVVTRVLEAPRERVWDAWTDPKQVVRWWGPRGFTTRIARMDVRPEGVWEHVMRGPDGAEYPNRSVFSEVVEPERIAFAHGGGGEGKGDVHFHSTWTFEAIDPRRTRLTMRLLFPTTAARDHAVQQYGALEGGVQTLERLAEHLSGGPSPTGPDLGTGAGGARSRPPPGSRGDGRGQATPAPARGRREATGAVAGHRSSPAPPPSSVRPGVRRGGRCLRVGSKARRRAAGEAACRAPPRRQRRRPWRGRLGRARWPSVRARRRSPWRSPGGRDARPTGPDLVTSADGTPLRFVPHDRHTDRLVPRSRLRSFAPRRLGPSAPQPLRWGRSAARSARWQGRGRSYAGMSHFRFTS